jgi:hypothetical protein
MAMKPPSIEATPTIKPIKTPNELVLLGSGLRRFQSPIWLARS